MKKEKTVITEMIDMFIRDIDKLQKNYKENPSLSKVSELSTLSHILTILQSRLEIEKQQIFDAHDSGQTDGLGRDEFYDGYADKYYNNKFKK